MTEATCSVFQTQPSDNLETVLNTVGQLHDHMEVRIVNDKNETVPLGTPGELLVRGYNSMLGYYDDEIKTKETLSENGWVRTGDVFELYENGYGQIVGRIKDIIIRGGENISPREIEDLLMTHPDIKEVYVIGIPDERLGEVIGAFAKVENNKQLNAADIKEFCKDKISHFKIPKYFEILENFPKTTSGKVQKYKIKEDYLSKNKNKN